VCNSYQLKRVPSLHVILCSLVHVYLHFRKLLSWRRRSNTSIKIYKNIRCHTSETIIVTTAVRNSDLTQNSLYPRQNGSSQIYIYMHTYILILSLFLDFDLLVLRIIFHTFNVPWYVNRTRFCPKWFVPNEKFNNNNNNNNNKLFL
jgi:hypothetical protein